MPRWKGELSSRWNKLVTVSDPYSIFINQIPGRGGLVNTFVLFLRLYCTIVATAVRP